VLKDKSGALIKFTYSGIIDLTPATAAVLLGSPDAKTTEFGDAGELNLNHDCSIEDGDTSDFKEKMERLLF
jgi:hypothetical protein